MSNPSPESLEAEASANDARPQREAECLDQQLEGISLNDPQPYTEPQEPNKIKRSARHILDKMSRIRLGTARITFTSGGLQAGRGSQGEVVVATLTLDDGNSLEPGKQVAVKKFLLSDDVDEERFLRTFANELTILDGLHHSHIVKIIGFVEDMNNRIAWLVFPWEANGNVREFLLSGKWELPERVSLINDVASGLEYLHSRQPPIRHGDLKSLNILVNADHRAVITDFGSARIQTDGRSDATSSSESRQANSADSNPARYDGSPEVILTVTNAELTLTGPSWSFRWAAPEVLNDEELCLASDIWALGWIAWEIVTDNYPFPDVKTSQAITLKVARGLLPSLHEDGQLSQIGRLCDVMVKCWKTEPKERPSAAECLETLQWIPSIIPRTRSEGISQIRSAALLLELGNIRRAQSRYDEALEFLEEGIAIAQSAGEKHKSANGLSLAADCHSRSFNYDKAKECSNQALAIYTSVGNSTGQAYMFHMIGDTYFAQYDYAKAEESYNQALALCTSTGGGVARANILLGLGNIHRVRSNYADAEDLYTQALVVYTIMRESVGQANTLRRLGQIHQAKSDHVKAEESFKQALTIFTSIGSSFGQASVWSELGLMHQAHSNYSAAEESFNRALAASTSTGDSSIPSAVALSGLGKIYEVRSDYAKAEDSYAQALAIWTSVGDNFGRINSLLALGESLLRQSRYFDAKSFLDDAVHLSSQIGYEWGAYRSEQILAEVVEADKLSIEPPP